MASTTTNKSRSVSYFNFKTEALMNTVNREVEIGSIADLMRSLSLSTSTKITGKGNKAVCAWSTTPILSCPGSTETCRKGCYGCTGNFRFPTVKKAQYRNLMVFSSLINLGKQQELIDTLVVMIKNSPAYYAGQFRLFEVGDFYNQAVIDVFVEVAKAMPGTLFWAYTRSFHLDFSALAELPNMCLFGSADTDNREQAESFAEKLGVRVAYALPEGTVTPVKGSIICPQQTGRFASCWECGLCFRIKKSRNISFLYH
jgi:hypothetical protein